MPSLIERSEIDFLQLTAESYRKAEAARFDLPLPRFAELLQEIARIYLPQDAGCWQIARFYSKLHLKDLALAQSCTGGNKLAWECFFNRYLGILYAAARSILNDEFMGRELADTACANLFFNAQTGQSGPSWLASYHGRGSLESWLRVFLFQAHIDRYRSERRFVSFDTLSSAIEPHCFSKLQSEAQYVTCVEETLRKAIRELDPEGRFILASYFLDGRNLAQIGRLLQIHESTVSRRLARAIQIIRKNVAHRLRYLGLSERAIQECLCTEVGEVSFDLRAELLFDLSHAEKQW